MNGGLATTTRDFVMLEARLNRCGPTDPMRYLQLYREGEWIRGPLDTSIFPPPPPYIIICCVCCCSVHLRGNIVQRPAVVAGVYHV